MGKTWEYFAEERAFVEVGIFKKHTPEEAYTSAEDQPTNNDTTPSRCSTSIFQEDWFLTEDSVGYKTYTTKTAK